MFSLTLAGKFFSSSATAAGNVPEQPAGGNALATLAPGHARNLGPWPGPGVGPNAALAAFRRSDYSGLTLDPAGKRLLFFGGGHGPCQLTDIRAFDLATLTWSSLYPPTPWADMVQANVTRYGAFAVPNKNPVPCARHTYTGSVVLGGRFYLFASSFAYVEQINGPIPNASFFNDVRLCWFDLAAGKWAWSKLHQQIGHHFACGACAAGDKALIVSPWSDAWIYDPATDSKKQLPMTCGSGGPAVVHFPPNGKYYALYPDYSVYEIDLPKSTAVKLVTTDQVTQSKDGMAGYTNYTYDPVNHLIGGDLKGGRYVVFDPTTKAWSQQSVAVEPGSSGTPSTVFFCAAHDPLSGCNISLGLDGNTWAYRPALRASVRAAKPAATHAATPAVSGRVQMSDKDNDGPNWTYANIIALRPWVHPGGDWRDANDVAQGRNPCAMSPPVSSLGDFSFDCTALVRRLVGDNTAIYLHPFKGGLRFGNPRLVVDGKSMPVLVQCYLDRSAGVVPGSRPYGMLSPAIVKFDLPSVTDVTSATLTLTALQVGAESVLAADYLDSPSFMPHGSRIEGIAATVARDPELATHADVLLYDNFTSADYIARNYIGGTTPHKTEVVDWPQYGIKAMRVWATTQAQKLVGARRAAEPKTQVVNGVTVNPPYARDVGNGYTHLFLRYLLEVGDDLPAGMTELGMKLPGFDGLYDLSTSGANTGAQPPDGWNATFAHTKCSPSNPGYYRLLTYHFSSAKGSKYPYGAAYPPTDGYLHPGINCIEEEVKLNAPGEADGELRVWLDGVLVLELTALVFRNRDSTRIQCIPYLLIYHGGMGLPKAPFHYDIGGVCVAKQYIGPPADLSAKRATVVSRSPSDARKITRSADLARPRAQRRPM